MGCRLTMDCSGRITTYFDRDVIESGDELKGFGPTAEVPWFATEARSVGRHEGAHRVRPSLEVTIKPQTHSPVSGSRNMLRCAALLGSLLGLVACDFGSLQGTPPETCTESGVQCQLPAGPLGVCERSQCGASDTPPCFRCISQH